MKRLFIGGTQHMKIIDVAEGGPLVLPKLAPLKFDPFTSAVELPEMDTEIYHREKVQFWKNGLTAPLPVRYVIYVLDGFQAHSMCAAAGRFLETVLNHYTSGGKIDP